MMFIEVKIVEKVLRILKSARKECKYFEYKCLTCNTNCQIKFKAYKFSNHDCNKFFIIITNRCL